MEESKYLKLARQARAENNSEDAKNFYGKVREEDPANGEAKFFYAYYSLYEGTNKEVPTRFANLCKVVVPAINFVNQSNATKQEKLSTIEAIVSTFVPETWSENRYMNAKNRETRVGDSYVTVFSSSDITSTCKTGMQAIRTLGDEISKMFGNDAEASRLAVIAWKEYVSLSQKWYAYAVKGDAEVYAEKIKKVDPTYVMPKKAGCISFGDRKD